MNNKEACAAYFRGQEAWKKAFHAMRLKWESYGRTGGMVTLRHPSAEERRALQKVLGRHIEEEDVKFSLQEFENALQRTKYAPITLKEVLDCYYGEEIRTRQDKAGERRDRIQNFFDRLIMYFREQEGDAGAVVCWLQKVAEQKQYGYYTLLTEWNRSEEQAVLLVQHVGEALLRAKQDDFSEIPLAVLAADVSGNPHYFDRGSVAGTLLMQGICSICSFDYPQNAYAWRENLLQYGILPDEVSDTVITYGLHLETETGLHPAYEGFCSMQEPGVLMHSTFKYVKRAYARQGVVWIVENEMVFGYLIEQLRGMPVTLLCTSGQPRTVALKLIEMLVRERHLLYYSGDIDPEGMRIADRIWQKFPDSIRIWRMGEQDYQKAISEEIISDRRLAILDMIGCPDLQEVVERVRAQKKAAYQENLLEDLLGDVRDSYEP